LNKTTSNIGFKKASIIACLFCFLNLPSFAQQWEFDSTTLKIYQRVVKLDIEAAFTSLPEPRNAQEHYVVGLAEALELLLTEDEEKFDLYEDRFLKRIGQRIKTTSNDYHFLRAELHLQWAFIYLKFGHELDAASHFRDAYHIAVACRDKFPDYLAIQKTTGLLEIVIGSVPEKYNWILHLLNMEGTIELGLKELSRVRDSSSPLRLEADLIHCLAHGFIFQKPEVGLTEVQKVLNTNPDNRLVLFLAASLAIKNFQSEVALGYLTSQLEGEHTGLPIYYADYLLGDVYLHKGEYQQAVGSYRRFLTHFKGHNNVKDAHYKMGLCYLLNGNHNDALHHFDDARQFGKEAVEADKSAARSLSEKNLPHIELSKARYATDGGYYDEARKILNSIPDKDLSNRKDQVEYFYRKARIEHRTGNTNPARLFYRQVIDMAGDENWYFAPNSCLQLGYLHLAQNEKREAKFYFQKALSYKRHEYKNSIDSKARSALSQMK
jgi:tetratricopeptide (TPR) repeat protein